MSGFTQIPLEHQLGRSPTEVYNTQQYCSQAKKSLKNYNYKQFFLNRLPFIQVLYTYHPSIYLVNDLLAGISVGMSSIPQAMGYTTLLKIPVQYGLYGIIFPSIFYSMFTTSRHASCTIAVAGSIFLSDSLQRMGYDDGALERMNSTVISDEMDERLQAMYALTFISGIVMVLGTVLKLGVLVRFSSEPHMNAIFSAITVTIILKQLSEIMGVTPDAFTGFLQTPKLFIDICSRIPESNITTLIISVVTLIVLVFVKEVVNVRFSKMLPVPIPIEMIVLVVTTWMSSMWDWNGIHNVKVIGEIPEGLPGPQSPLQSDWTEFIKEGIIVAIVTYLGSPIMIKHFSMKHNYEVNLDQETFALGVTRMFGSCFSSVGLGVASARLLVMESCHGKTQLTYVFAVLTSLGVVLFLTDYADKLPNCVVAVVIVASFIRAFQTFARVRKYWRRDKIFFLLWIFSFTMAILFTISDGILYGLGFSVLVTALRTMFPHMSEMQAAYYNDTRYLVTSKKYHKSKPIYNSVKIIAINGAMFYANSLQLKESIVKMLATEAADIKSVDDKQNISYINHGFVTEDPTTVYKKSEKNREEVSLIDTVILDLSGVPFIDTVTLRELCSLQSILLDKYGVTLKLSGCTESVRNSFIKAPAILKRFEAVLYMTVEDALISPYDDQKSVTNNHYCNGSSEFLDACNNQNEIDNSLEEFTEL